MPRAWSPSPAKGFEPSGPRAYPPVCGGSLPASDCHREEPVRSRAGASRPRDVVTVQHRTFGSKAVSEFLNRNGKGCVKPFAERICNFIHFSLMSEHERFHRTQREPFGNRFPVFRVFVGLQL